MKVYGLFREVTNIYERESYRQKLFNKQLVSLHATRQSAENAAIENGLMILGDSSTIGVPALIEEIEVNDLTIVRFVPALVLEKENEFVFDFSPITVLQGKQIVVKKTPNMSLFDAISSIHQDVKSLYYDNWHEFTTYVYTDTIHYMISSIKITNDIKGVNIVNFPVIGN